MVISTLVLTSCTLPRFRTDFPKEPCGIWTWTRKGDISRKDYPYVIGSPIVVWWRHLEPEEGKFAFPELDERITEAVQDGMYWMLSVWVGQRSPDWIFDKGVPIVLLKDKHPDKESGETPSFLQTYPYYLDENYKKYYYRMIRAVGKHVRSLPAHLREKLVHVVCCEGSTGDPGGYKGRPEDDKYAISAEEWAKFRLETWEVFQEAFREGPEPPVALAFTHLNPRAGKYGKKQREWILKHNSELWMKTGFMCHGYQFNRSLDRAQAREQLWGAYQTGKGRKKSFYWGSVECEWITTGWFQENPEMNFYWTAIFGLHNGLDLWYIRNDALKTKRFEDSFRLFNRYANHEEPGTSPGAWCALRYGLDVSDTERFPVSEFGEAKQHNKERFLAITKKFASRGAKQGDPKSATGCPWVSRHADAMNDVAWRVLPGNYYKFLRQIDPDKTSIGWWRVGPEDQPYGRFARSFGGSDSMFFDLDDGFFAGKPKDKPKNVAIRVIYFDKGRGKWSLKYDAVNNPAKTALTVTKKDSGRWKEIEVKVNDANFSNRGPGKSDVLLFNEDSEDDIFHIIEINR